MTTEGFAIHCPHCQRWSFWNEHPREKVLDSPDELKQIINEQKNASLIGKQKEFYHPKLLRCQSPTGYCPASFEAFVYRGDEDPQKYLSKVESWSVKRHFQLRKKDKQNLWIREDKGKYGGILFNTRQVSRQRYIELESLMDRELVSRLIAGMCLEIDLPLTFFSANIFELNDGRRSVQKCWMPIEGYSQKRKLVPPRFNLFCETCRNISVKKLFEEFESEEYGVNNCRRGYGRDGKCLSREAACEQEPKDWNHCPDFMEERKEKCPCYNSDVTLIEAVENKWREGNVPDEGVWFRCHAGFLEIAFPIEVHGYLVGIAMTGQLFFDPSEIRKADEFINSKKVGQVEHRPWEVLEGKTKELDEARQILVGFELKNRKDDKEIFLVNKVKAKQKIELLLPNLERFKKIAESHYKDFRARSENAFCMEILEYIRGHKEESNFFGNGPILNVLRRMREFWAFKAVGFLCYSSETNNVCVISYSYETEDKIEEKGFNFPGEKIGQINFMSRQEHPLCWLYDPRAPKKSKNPLIWQFLQILEDVKSNPVIGLPEKGCHFLVFLPFGDEIYIFTLISRDIRNVSCLESREPEGVSELCQEFILRTCTEVIHEFTNLMAITERRERFWIEHFKDLQNKIQKGIKNLSVQRDITMEVLLQDDEISDELRDSIEKIKNKDSNILPIIEQCFRAKFDKLNQIYYKK
ncbi:MAG: PocR ligand-binding domain-containing protein [Sedimentisphaerales bacterium]|nr:PocR ligand-binding domain-containing protein [Sedimentisphaerales bacterium]